MIRKIPRSARLAFWLLAAVLLSGCQNSDDITSYQVPRPEPPEQARLLGAIFPTKTEQSWFFKIEGPVAAVEEHKQAFRTFLESVRLGDKPEQPPTWGALPKGWKEGPGDAVRYKILRLGPESALELGVTQAKGTLLENINRWRGQISLPPVSKDKLADETETITINDVKVTLMDKTGVRAPKGRPGMGPMAGHPPMGGHPPVSGQPFQYDKPEDWRRVPCTPPAVLAFKITEGGGAPEVKVTLMGKDPGSLSANVNRWRGEVGLGEVTEEQARRDQKPARVSGVAGVAYDLVGPAGTQQNRSHVVWIARGEQTWFFKLLGPAELVNKQQAAFEKFLGSVRFDAGTGADK